MNAGGEYHSAHVMPGACVQAFARRLFRFLKRALTLWPQQRAMEPLIALWLAYLAPWGSHSFGSTGEHD